MRSRTLFSHCVTRARLLQPQGAACRLPAHFTTNTPSKRTRTVSPIAYPRDPGVAISHSWIAVFWTLSPCHGDPTPRARRCGESVRWSCVTRRAPAAPSCSSSCVAAAFVQQRAATRAFGPHPPAVHAVHAAHAAARTQQRPLPRRLSGHRAGECACGVVGERRRSMRTRIALPRMHRATAAVARAVAARSQHPCDWVFAKHH
jgi:hypothetical protein